MFNSANLRKILGSIFEKGGKKSAVGYLPVGRQVFFHPLNWSQEFQFP